MSEHTAESDAVFKKPLSEGVFASAAAQYGAHDPKCVSIPNFWLPRHGGVSCPSDLGDCLDCGVTFYNEGLSWLNYDAPDDEDEIHVCGCCAAKRGVTLYRTQYGVSATPPPPEPKRLLLLRARRPRRVLPPAGTDA